MADPQAAFLDAVRIGYPALTLGSFLFLLVWEGDRRSGFVPRRARHVLRNLALFAVMVVVADGLVGGVVLGIGRHLFDVPRGLLTPLELPLAAMVVAGVFATDFASYAFHRLSHRWRELWLFHAVHHSDPQLDATTGLRFHPIDMAFYVASVAGTLVALGIPLWVEGVRALILNPLSMAQHANVPWPAWVERYFAWLLVTPAMHRVHHDADAPGIDANFGQVFSLWDRLFGTYRAPGAADPPRIGVPALAADEWQTLSGLLLTPWRARSLEI
ncbi:MAG: sterol desaturase family protein [Aromatoleum sp.]|nr:sterol desaturase family protein [Aromatoleum sp.]